MTMWDLELGNGASRLHFQASLYFKHYFPGQLAHIITASAAFLLNNLVDTGVLSVHNLRFVLFTVGSGISPSPLPSSIPLPSILSLLCASSGSIYFSPRDWA